MNIDIENKTGKLDLPSVNVHLMSSIGCLHLSVPADPEDRDPGCETIILTFEMFDALVAAAAQMRSGNCGSASQPGICT